MVLIVNNRIENGISVSFNYKRLTTGMEANYVLNKLQKKNLPHIVMQINIKLL